MLKKELEKDFDDVPMSSICSIDDTDKLVVHCFKIAHPLNHILGKFNTISNKYSNDFFRTFWKRLKREYEGASHLNFANIVQIWENTLKECITFMESLRDRSISLSLVHELVTEKGKEYLSQDITNLEASVCVCTGTTPLKPEWIGNCVGRMYQYQSLCHHASAAKVFVQLKETLGLTGDFSMMENLAEEVRNNCNVLNHL